MALKGNQKRLDKNNNNRIDAQDFKILKAEKAKGRGMGLQDEKVKPGKVMKAKRGTGVLTEKGTSKTFRGFSKAFEGPTDLRGRVATITGVKPNAKIRGQRKKFKSMDEMRKAKGFKPGETASQFNKRRAALAGARNVASKSRIGKIALGVAAVGLGAKKYLESKMKKKKDKRMYQDKPKSKMGGGMMKRPMGYDVGGGVSKAKEHKKKIKNMAGTALGYAGEMARGLGAATPTGAASEAARQLVKRVKERRERKKERRKSMIDKLRKAPKTMPSPPPRKLPENRRRPKGTIPRIPGKPPVYTPLKSGGTVTAKCKLGRNKPTKMY